jgi:hypothetical protein
MMNILRHRNSCLTIMRRCSYYPSMHPRGQVSFPLGRGGGGGTGRGWGGWGGFGILKKNCMFTKRSSNSQCVTHMFPMVRILFHNRFLSRIQWHGVTPLMESSRVKTCICCVLGWPDGRRGLCGQRQQRHSSQTSE